jgi:hypothetical protein
MRTFRGALQPSNPAVFDGLARRVAWVSTALLLLLGVAFAARAEDDLPGRVGRVAEFGGQLFLSPEDRASEWQSVGLNYPVASGDNLWVGGDGRAEVDYGGGQFRLAGDTNLHVSRLDENRIALFIAQGRVIVRVRILDAGDTARIDTPNTQIQLTRLGLYRIDVSPDRQSTLVTVREGEAVLSLANGAQQTLPGQTAVVTGPDPAAADIRNGIGQDGFDEWSASRDRRYEQPRATAYVSQQMVGYADLDQYGTWQSTPEYGPVWYPTTVAADWAPYSDGYWTTVGGFGSTWVDAAPWGYAPFHYGRWARVGGRWGWCPGVFVARPVWAPALVGWVGGAGWGVSVRVGSPVYGWVPLGWGEPLHPWWNRCSNNCWARYNRPFAVNVAVRPTDPPTHFRNAAYPGALTAVSSATLAGRLPVAANRVPVPTQQMNTAPVLATAPAVASGPLRIPGTRAGTAGTPPPASTFYPVSRPGRIVQEPMARPSTPGAGAAVAPSGQAMSRPTGGVSPSPAGVPGTPAPFTRGAPVASPGATTNSQVPMQNAPNAAGAPARSDTTSRTRPTPQAGTTSVPTSSAPMQTAPAYPRPSPTPQAGTTSAPTSSAPVQTAPAHAAPVARPAPARQPPVERVAPTPMQPQAAPPAAQMARPGGPVAAPAPMPHAGGQAAPATAPAHNGAPMERQAPPKQAPPKVEPVPVVPAKP